MKRLVAFGLALLGMAASSPAQTVNTIVPSTTGLAEPHSVAATPDDQVLYITDAANNRVVKFETGSGAATTLVGRSGGFLGVDGAFAQARFFDPKGIVLARGGLVVADSGDSALRFIDLTNKTVSTLAGLIGEPGTDIGAAASARFISPRGLALDTNGSIYIADLGARAIRKLDTNNVVTTVASTNLSGPSGVAVADDGRIFVADRRGHSIKLVATDGTVSKIAGVGEAGAVDSIFGLEASFNLPESVKWLGSAFGLLVSDSGNHVLRRVYYNGSEGVWSVETYAGRLGEVGAANGPPLEARFNFPAGLASYSTGFLVVDDQNRSVRQVLVSSAPPRINDPRVGYVDLVVDPNSGNLITQFFPVTDSTFNNAVTIAVIGDENVSHHYTFGPGRTNILQADPVAAPTLSSPTAPEFVPGGGPSTMPNTIANPLPVLSLKAFSAAEGRTSSGVAQGTFRFQVATPVLDLASSPGAITFKNSTTNAVIYYTKDGTDPTEGAAGGNPSSVGPFFHGDRLTLDIKTNTAFRSRGFLPNFQPSRIAALELSPTNFAPNRISLGFANGEASSDFTGSAGQSFIAPVTLATLAGQKMYGLQFNLIVTNNTPATPAGAYAPRFHSFLMEQLPGNIYVPILPRTFRRTDEVITTNVVETATFTNVFFTTNRIAIFSNLLVTNAAGNFLGVGWLERAGTTNLYDTTKQDLIKYSQAHDSIFESAGQKVVVGAFSFRVPTAAAIGDSYRVTVGRPSANADGVSEDVLIEAPDGTDPTIPISANRQLNIASRPYLVGDVAPFRWFNAGDFGDTNLVNNDLQQLQQSLIYGLNSPPVESDFFDAMDSCCISTNGSSLSSSSEFYTDSNPVLNSIGHGDGALTLGDLYVSFRRSLDPTLVHYMRYWSNGARVAVVATNRFRGLPQEKVEKIIARSGGLVADPALAGLASGVRLAAPKIRSRAGDVLRLPVTARVTGPSPVRSLLMRWRVSSLDGASTLAAAPAFVPAPILGAPTAGGRNGATGFAGAWIDLPEALPAGEHVLGTLEISIPASTTADAIYSIQFERVEASPNGFAQIPVTVEDGIILMDNRAATPWNDEIPDAWRIQYFGSLMNILSAPSADADGDGLNNLEEFRAGTNPVDPRSGFAVRGESSPLASIPLVLSWPTIAGKFYRLESSPSLAADTWTVIEARIPGTGAMVERGPAADGLPTRFYRVRIVE